MEIIDNIHKTLKEDLVVELREGSKLSIAASCFSIYAFQELKEQLKDIEELRFVFTSPTFTTEKASKQKREFYIPRLYRERNLYGSEFEVKLRNELTQRAVAKECAEWIKKKACFKSNRTGENMMGFANVDDKSYMPLNGFTTVELGCERGDNAYTMINKLDAPYSQQYLTLFEQLWHDTVKLQVVTDESHNFRNGGKTTTTDDGDQRENRYLRLLNRVIRNGVKTKVLMLSATPVNNRFNDLKNQLQLAYEGDSVNIDSLLNTSRSIDDIFRQAQAAYNRWTRIPAEECTTAKLLQELDFDFFEVLDSVTIARSRRHIKLYYDTPVTGDVHSSPVIEYRDFLIPKKKKLLFSHRVMLILTASGLGNPPERERSLCLCKY